MFRTSVHGFFPTFHALITWFELSMVKLCRNDLKGKKLLRVSGRFELSRVKLCRNDLKGKKLVRVSGRFELSRVRVTEGKIIVNVRGKSRGNGLWFEWARVRVIGSQLYMYDVLL